MPAAVNCPTPQELTDFGLGRLPERAAAAVAGHLESCTKCRQVVADVAPDSFLDQVRAAGPAGSSFPPSLAQPGKAPNSASRPAIPNVPCPNVPAELARHPKYLILRELGRGGMGVVYQARQTMMDRQVVIKVINRALIEQPGALERFHREIRAAAQLSHPNIVTAYDAEHAGDLHMLVMEFVPGQSLAEVLQKRGQLQVVNACHYMRQVALGLQHAHERGMVHRDIKPNNLILMPGPKGQVKILDFGLAKIISERHQDLALTSDNHYMGTPDYCAPEQALDAAKADIRADLYSLGCALYCLLAGRPPFQEETAMKTAWAHMQKEAQPLPELRPDVPAELWQVVKRLLAKDPAQRYQKPIEVFQALSVFVKPTAKPHAQAGKASAPGVASPVKGTQIAADSGEIKKIQREGPCKAPLKEVPAEKEASPFADLTDTGTASKKAGRARMTAKLSATAWLKRPGVLAAAVSISLALILMAAIIIKLKTSEGTIVLEDLPSDAKVTVDGSTVTVEWVHGKTAEIRIAAGKKQRIEVRINGVRVVSEEVELEAGGRKPIIVSIEGPGRPPSPQKLGELSEEPEKNAPKLPVAPRKFANKDGASSPASEDKPILEVSTLPAEQLIERVKANLKALNPGFDGELKPTIDEKGAVTGLKFVTDHVRDVSPLIALKGLKSLSCLGSNNNRGELADLSPLKGMHLTELECYWNNRISDLSPLEGMQLKKLSCAGTSISDLSPLKGMPLAELYCGWTKISDLSPLKGMRLTSFGCGGTQVSDLSLLKDMPLKSLICLQTVISDLSPLKGMPLEELYCQVTRVTDLAPLKDLPLKKLACDPERDMEILRSSKTLKEINFKPVAQFWKEVDELKHKIRENAFLTNSIDMKFVLVQPGTFVMGSPANEVGHSDIEEQHDVEITRAFYLGVFEVTQEQFQRIMGKNPSCFSSTGSFKHKVQGVDTRRFPVDSVSWDDAVKFCRRLSERPEEKLNGRTYRLPTEAEWEYSCRGGHLIKKPSLPFHFGNSLSSTQANFNGNNPYGGAPKGPFLGCTTKVGSYHPNDLGLYDLHGNVWEWCADWYDAEYYKNSPRQDPKGPEKNDELRVVRGGSWGGNCNYGRYCRSAFRLGERPSVRYMSYGFRVVLVISAKSAAQPRPTLPDNASVDDLRQALKNADPAVRELAAGRLASIGPKAEPAIYALAETLTDGMNPTKVRAFSAFAIARIGVNAKPVVPSLVQALERSQPLEIRQCAAEALAQINYPANKEAVPDILDAIEHDKDATVRRKCVWALFRMDKSEFKQSGADKLLAKMLDERDKNIVLARCDAALMLANALLDSAPDKTTDVLLEMLTSTMLKVTTRLDVKVAGDHYEFQDVPNGDNRYRVAQGLAWLGKKASSRKDVIAALQAATKDADPRLRESATAALKDLGVP